MGGIRKTLRADSKLAGVNVTANHPPRFGGVFVCVVNVRYGSKADINERLLSARSRPSPLQAGLPHFPIWRNVFIGEWDESVIWRFVHLTPDWVVFRLTITRWA